MARTARQRAALRKAQLASARKRRGKGKGKLGKANKRLGRARFARNLAIGVAAGAVLGHAVGTRVGDKLTAGRLNRYNSSKAYGGSKITSRQVRSVKRELKSVRKGYRIGKY